MLKVRERELGQKLLTGSGHVRVRDKYEPSWDPEV